MASQIIQASSQPRTLPVFTHFFAYLRSRLVLTVVVPCLLACLFAFLAIRTAWDTEPAFPDASRHAMNGALVYDSIREGGWRHPIEYTKQYYAKLPAISLPFHPPVFALWEAVFYAFLGVSYVAARMAVGLAVALSCVLLYRLVIKTHKSPVFAVGVILAFGILPLSQWLAQEVMLEFPGLVFVLIAMTCAYHLNETVRYSSLWAIAFAVSAGLAVWTKQHAIFLAAVPPACALLAGDWRRVRDLRMWTAVAFILLSFAGVMSLSRRADAFTNRGWGTERYTKPEFFLKTVTRHIGESDDIFFRILGPAAVTLLILSLVFWLVQRIRRTGVLEDLNFYVVWVIGVVSLMLVLPFADLRYVFFALPASLVIIGSFLHYVVAKVWRARGAVVVATLLMIGSVAASASFTNEWMRGPHKAANIVLASRPERVLYCGKHNGSFVMSVRSLDPNHRTTVIRGDKISLKAVGNAGWVSYLQKLGISFVVAETHPKPEGIMLFCETIVTGKTNPLVLTQEIEMEGSRSYIGNQLRIYRVPNPSPDPINEIWVPSSIVGGGLKIELSPKGGAAK